MPCTVIEQQDAIDQILDRKKHPLWRGERTKLLRSMPANLEAWEDYFRVYAACSQREPPDYADANAAYDADRERLDAGAEASWPDRKDKDEVSAVQSAMHLYFRDRRTFFAEYQNEPLPPEGDWDPDDLRSEEVAARLSRVPRGKVPRECSRVTAGIDVGKRVLWYVVVAWSEGFGGSVIDYGAFPDQGTPFFTAANARDTLAQRFPGRSEEEAIYEGLRVLAGAIVGREYPRDGGTGYDEGPAGYKVDRCLIDSGDWTDTIYKFCRQSEVSPLLYPSKGFGIKAGHVQMSEWKEREGERRGWNWILGFPESGRGRLVKFDANMWKSFTARRLRIGLGSPSALTLFGDRTDTHTLFAEHASAEHREQTAGRGRVLEEWECRPNRDNHLWDALILAAVAASVAGLKFNPGGEVEKPKHRPRISLDELAKRGAELPAL